VSTAEATIGFPLMRRRVAHPQKYTRLGAVDTTTQPTCHCFRQAVQRP